MKIVRLDLGFFTYEVCLSLHFVCLSFPVSPKDRKSADKLSDRVMKLNDGININRVRGDKLWI